MGKIIGKVIATIIVVGGGNFLTRQFSTEFTNEMAMLQMQNVDYVPNLGNAMWYSETMAGVIMGVILWSIWKGTFSQHK